MNVIEVNNLSHRFSDGTWALKGVDLTVAGGEFLVLAGPNGSGKTVLMKHLNGLMKPSGGSVLVNGQDVGKHPDMARKSIGLVFQNPDSQFVGQTVLEEVRFGPENLRLPEARIIELTARAVEITGLGDKIHRRPHTLSGGEKRRLAVAGVLAMEPEVIILDEPFTGLDLQGTREVLRGILRLFDLGHTVILITHEVEKVLAHAGRMVIMKDGKIVRNDHPANLLTAAGEFGIRIPPGADLEAMTWIT